MTSVRHAVLVPLTAALAFVVHRLATDGGWGELGILAASTVALTIIVAANAVAMSAAHPRRTHSR